MPFTPRPPSEGGGGNATVPDDAPIQPPQAFVDAMPRLIAFTTEGTSLNWSNLGITGLDAADADIIAILVNSAQFSGCDISGNLIPNTSEILAAMAASPFAVNSSGVLNLSGGTNTEPTGGADNADIATLVAAGWTVTVNIGGVPTTFTP